MNYCCNYCLLTLNCMPSYFLGKRRRGSVQVTVCVFVCMSVCTRDDKLQVFKISVGMTSINSSPTIYKYHCDNLLHKVCKMQGRHAAQYTSFSQVFYVTSFFFLAQTWHDTEPNKIFFKKFKVFRLLLMTQDKYTDNKSYLEDKEMDYENWSRNHWKNMICFLFPQIFSYF